MRKRKLLGMSLADWGRFAADEPKAARELLEGVANVLEVTGRRLMRKSRDVRSEPRQERLRRRAYQRLELAKLTRRHAHDLLLRATGNEHLCSADPSRLPLEGL